MTAKRENEALEVVSQYQQSFGHPGTDSHRHMGDQAPNTAMNTRAPSGYGFQPNAAIPEAICAAPVHRSRDPSYWNRSKARNFITEVAQCLQHPFATQRRVVQVRKTGNVHRTQEPSGWDNFDSTTSKLDPGSSGCRSRCHSVRNMPRNTPVMCQIAQFSLRHRIVLMTISGCFIALLGHSRVRDCAAASL